jgi:hypothetical protein
MVLAASLLKIFKILFHRDFFPAAGRAGLW